MRFIPLLTINLKGSVRMAETKIFGHRGCMGTFPENTLLGFQQAICKGVDGIELDVQLTKDGEVVVIHDETLERTTDGTGFIKDLTLQEIKQYSVGAKFAHFKQYDQRTWDAEGVPTLQEVLELLAPDKAELNIELKTTLFKYDGIEEKVLDLVNEYGNGRKVIYSSFHLPSILRIKQLDPHAEIAWLLGQKPPHPEDYLQSLDLEALHLSRSSVITDPLYLKDFVDRVRVWTVNNQDEIKQLQDLGVQAIMTDFPEEALANRSGGNALA